jgi:hypothetical protein
MLMLPEPQVRYSQTRDVNGGRGEEYVAAVRLSCLPPWGGGLTGRIMERSGESSDLLVPLTTGVSSWLYRPGLFISR